MERPIILKAHEVRGILDGRQTQLRRIVNEQYRLRMGDGFFKDSVAPNYLNEWGNWQVWVDNAKTMRCPFGQVGDRLWGRETWAVNRAKGAVRPVIYRPDLNCEPQSYGKHCIEDPVIVEKWSPSTHMPRSVSRILLEIVSVRVERVRDIMNSEADAIAQGMFFTDYGRQCFHQHRSGPFPMDALGCEAPCETHSRRDGWMWDKTTSHEQCLGAAWAAFGNLWEKDYGAQSWVDNPWVWVVEFKRVTGDE